MSKPDLIIGIDPGINGAIAVIDVKNDTVEVFDVPTVLVEASGRKKTARKKSEYDKLSMSALLSKYAKRKVAVRMEQVHAMPGQGVTSMFNFGRGVGLWEGMFAAFGWEPEFVTPQAWKKEYGDRLFKSMTKPDILKEMKKADYNRASLTKRREYDEAKKRFESEKKSAKDNMKDEARDLAVELYPELVDSFKRKKDSDRAEALLIAEMKRREIYEQG
jgi:crossover junction endodeoxyribonuclease RuvC